MLPKKSHSVRTAAVAVAILAVAASGAAQSAPPLLIEPARNALFDRALAGQMGEFGTLAGTVSAPPASLLAMSGGGQAILALTPGRRLVVQLTPRDEPGIGSVWTGQVVGDPYSVVHLRVERGSLAGRISTRDETLQLIPLRNGRAAVRIVPATAPLPDIVRTLPERLRPPSDRGNPLLSAPSSDSSVFDVLVIVDRATASDSPFGMPLVIDMVMSAIIDMNIALRNSEVNAQVRLVKLKRDNYPIDGSDIVYMDDLLEHVTDPNDAYFKRAHKWRDRFGADFVAVITRKNDELCGLAWLGGERDGLQPDDEASAFSATNWRCLDRDTLAHEIGHNMGAQHSRLDLTSSRLGAYEFSYGYKVEPEFATIMAYTCVSCGRALHYSNPDVRLNGTPTGIAGGPNSAANAWGLERDREVIAAFRPCKKNCGS